MNTRGWILGAVVLACGVFLFQCQKQATEKQVGAERQDLAKIAEAANAGQFHKIDKKILREAIQQYKQPVLPPLTSAQSPIVMEDSAPKQTLRPPQSLTVYAQATPVQQPTSGAVNNQAPPAATTSPASQSTMTPTQTMEQRDSYVPPIEDKTVTQQPAAQQPNSEQPPKQQQ